MKIIYNILAFTALILCLFTACNDSFLDKDPLDSLSTANPFQSTTEVEKYLNQFYDNAFIGHPGGVAGSGIAYNDQVGDNLVSSSLIPRIAGTSSLGSASKLTQYTQIRSINFLLENRGNIKGNVADVNNLIGEAYFFRAHYYFQMIKNWGDVTWVNRVLPAKQELMEVPRDSRVVVMDSILADLDKASTLLKVRSNSITMRVHRVH